MKREGFILFNYVIAMLVTLLITGGALTAGIHTIQNFKTYELISECDAIDHALEMWSKSHKGVKESSIVVQNGKITYQRLRLYPETLEELGKIQKMGYFAHSIDLKKFHYATQDGGTRYKLEVILHDGTVYTSKKSNT